MKNTFIRLFGNPITSSQFKEASMSDTDFMVLHSNSVHRAADSAGKLRGRIHDLEGMVSDRDRTINDQKMQIQALTAILNEAFPLDVGGSTGGVVG